MNTNKAQIWYFCTQPHSPLGPLWLLASEHGLCYFLFGKDESGFIEEIAAAHLHGPRIEEPSLKPVLDQVQAYLRGELQQFSVKIDWNRVTPFQAAVYRAVMAVPYGETRTYGEIAEQIGRPRAARAVGTANGANPIPLIIPCHRLVGADGSLRGYGGVGGIQTKQRLIDLERANR